MGRLSVNCDMREEWSVLDEGSGNHVRLPEDALYQQSLHDGSRWQRGMYMWNGRGLGLIGPTMKDDFTSLNESGVVQIPIRSALVEHLQPWKHGHT